MKRIYFDNAATTPIDKRVLKVIKPYLSKYYGNPSSSHQEGHITRVAIYNARKQCAEALGCDMDEIFFTSGASESNAWANEIWPLHYDEKVHDSLRVFSPDGRDADTYAVSYINNETGNNDYDYYRHWGGFYDVFLDLTQAIGHINIDLHADRHIIGASLSGHKFGSPKGIGLIYIRKDQQKKMKPLIFGHQQNSFRGGTENVAGIVGLGKAIELAIQEVDKNNKQINKVVNYIYENIPIYYCNYPQGSIYFTSEDNPYLPYIITEDGIKKKNKSNHIINITFKHLLGATAVQIFDQYGIAISAGSACNSNSEKPSHILLHSAYNESEALRTIRISIGKQNTIKEAKRFIKVLEEVIKKYDVD